MIEGGGSKEFLKARELARREPILFGRLVDLLTEAVIAYLQEQLRSGAEALQLFDSWAGVLPPDERARWSTAPLKRIVDALRGQAPVLCFPRGIGAAYAAFATEVRPDGLSLDTTVDPAWAAAAIDPGVCLQGNLDPALLVTGGDAMLAGAEAIRAALRERPHVFNLGHGVLPQTPPDHVAALVRALKTV